MNNFWLLKAKNYLQLLIHSQWRQLVKKNFQTGVHIAAILNTHRENKKSWTWQAMTIGLGWIQLCELQCLQEFQDFLQSHASVNRQFSRVFARHIPFSSFFLVNFNPEIYILNQRLNHNKIKSFLHPIIVLNKGINAYIIFLLIN